MNLYQFNWKINLFKGTISLREGSREIGQLNLFQLLSKSCIASIRNEKYILHSEILDKNKVRIFDRDNEKLLATLTLKLWNSSTQLSYNTNNYTLKSSFLGIFGTHWVTNSQKVVSFNNNILSGSITESVPEKEIYYLLIISALQSMMLYSFLFLLMIVLLIIIAF